jgi:tetratricopeptide (TPR) repeat protein
MRARRAACLAGLGVTFAALGPARAEPAPADRALATALFKEGRSLMDAGNYPEACRKFEESQRLDPGGGTLLNVALCHEKEGKTASAWAEFTQALSLARRDNRADRAELARQHVAALEPALARLTVRVPNTSDLPGRARRRGGAGRGRPAWGTAMPVDPGEHLVEASAPGRKPWAARVTISPSGVSALDVPPLDPAPAPASYESQAPEDPGRPGRRLAGYLTGGVGVAALGVGVGFALRANGLRNDSDELCEGFCSQRGVDLNEQAQTSADVATVALAAGAAATAAGLYLVLTSGPKARVRAGTSAGPGFRGVVLGGEF